MIKKLAPIAFAWVCLSFPSTEMLNKAINTSSPPWTDAQVQQSKIFQDGSWYDWEYESFYYTGSGFIAQEQYIAERLVPKGITVRPCD